MQPSKDDVFGGVCTRAEQGNNQCFLQLKRQPSNELSSLKNLRDGIQMRDVTKTTADVISAGPSNTFILVVNKVNKGPQNGVDANGEHSASQRTSLDDAAGVEKQDESTRPSISKCAYILIDAFEKPKHSNRRLGGFES